ncbi:MAG: SUMF1/EgtB/PvdO family nonheme iron enzyme [Leptolyngbya sp. SIO4C5]|nr:SUMF1/EgtB/PvdO family nonheme iron enzyme [Leptolyngbya sp. SIO4C5]
MSRNWAIAIGISHYDNLQDLTCAQRDAEAMGAFFLGELRFEQVYYFSENAPPIPQDYGPPLSSRPTYGTLHRFLRVRFEKPFLRTGDNFWFFFAGHGMCHENRDYLMPLDADPGDVERTAIPLSYVSERLRRCGADNVVLLIDACRSANRSGLGVGHEMQKGVVTLFSCSPHERSYEIETPPIQHGSFTYALLQGLRLQGEGNCATVERLYQHLRYQVPTLNRQYQKPLQTPYAIVEPASKYHLILLPRSATVRDAETLKLEAFRAEQAKDFDLAEQLWIRVSVVSPGDPDAIAGIRRVDRLREESASTKTATPPQSSAASRSERPASPVEPMPIPPKDTSPPVTPTGPKRPARAPHRQNGRLPLLHVPLSRRRFIQIAGFAGAGTGAMLLGRAVLQSSVDTSLPELTPESKEGTTVSFDTVTVNNRGEVIDQQRQQTEFRTETLSESVTLDLRLIPEGTFQMGSSNAEEGHEENESPLRPVTVSSFWMGKYPVTQAQWQAVADFDKVNRDLDLDPSRFKGSNRPVEQITWYDAVEFCDRLSQHTGRICRLPSEAEWEYACRARTLTPFTFGETITTELANYDGNSTYKNEPEGEYRAQTTAVGIFLANAFGLYDMHGNVYEWCRRDYGYKTSEEARNDGSAWISSGESNARPVRGGSWGNDPWYCRSASRDRYSPDLRYSFLGFRVVCSSAWTLQ